MRKRVLFLCTSNSCRSQMAEGMLRSLASDRFDVFSAGVNPTHVHPLAIRVMQEISIDISRQRSKSIDEFLGQEFDYVITLCDDTRQTCPFFPGAHELLHWSVPDPAEASGSEEETLAVVRTARDYIHKKIVDLIK
ncbi:MAG TPA: arsenate reductase ArsC [bacterium]|nr:arsenate reductase ArsC [bacterium]